jgi:hypothetical protein
VVVRNDFLYVADSKLCGADAMEHIRARGRAVRHRDPEAGSKTRSSRA